MQLVQLRNEVHLLKLRIVFNQFYQLHGDKMLAKMKTNRERADDV